MEDISQRSHPSYCRGFQGISSLNTNTFGRTTQKKTEDIISWIRDIYIVVRKNYQNIIESVSPGNNQIFFLATALKDKISR